MKRLSSTCLLIACCFGALPNASAESQFQVERFDCNAEQASDDRNCKQIIREKIAYPFSFAVFGSPYYILDSVALQARIPGRKWVKLKRQKKNILREYRGVLFSFNLPWLVDQLDTSADYLRNNLGFEVRAHIESVSVGGNETRDNCPVIEFIYMPSGWHYRKKNSNKSWNKAEVGNTVFWQPGGTSNDVKCGIASID